ncbi:SMI1/KNR4 family protein [Clostridium sp. UBA6640]|uniref:SMI1/KNR4 family protein n=1 Tax=Clostridium sp. UBA6640 TaxID=1946370 RepID=UPI0025BF6049|nr:SMI1/KNR4 family protein [Clostridium sp. UBA6640]
MENTNKLDFLNRYTLNKEIKVELVGIKDIDKNIIPNIWVEIFEQKDVEHRVICLIQYWESILSYEMRNTISYFKEHLQNVELMRLGSKHYILYSIRSLTTEKVLFYCGGNPLEKSFDEQKELKKDWGKVPEKVKQFYEEIHDGFYYFPSRSMGLDAIENITYLDEYEWSIVDELEEPIKIDIKSSYGFFSNGVGKYVVIDINNFTENGATLWSSKSLPKYNLDFWDIVDEWMVIGFN